ncbi:Hypothetical predicted protein [Olea europaea subsp. europaea]|uniref:NB-ARC domain-containing protein n=1 Tax=Olea europaea subsp. europaea TaxID=158383 RepID=A0A8S0RTI8_OLEEU|nr:Hypothetical predicted protein [Olea europaea subsp. europaea]
MGGIGKTTLARNVYDDSYVAFHFYIRAWVTLSPQYRKREFLLSILDHFVVLTTEMRKESDEKLAVRLYKSLKVTTRLTNVAGHAGSSEKHHQMHFLNEEQSWNLFREKVFGQENCPPELDTIGKTIAKNWQGFPLSTVVIAGLLSNVGKARDEWEHVAENLSSFIAEKDGQCSEILNLSFKHLPTHLKACFLYVGVFPEYYEIPISRLIKLWVAEGFLKPKTPKHLDEGSNGKIKSCGIHDLLRELCARIAHKEKFFCVKSKYLQFVPEEATFMRRLSIHDDVSYSPSEEDVTVQSMSRVRSFIYSGWDETQLHSYYYFGFLLLRVLDMVGLELTKFPDKILQLVNLRCIAITCLGPVWVPIDGEFPKLKFLHIWETDLEHWRADKTHFPSLEHLILWKSSKLVEIPPSIGEIETFQIIQTGYSTPSVVKSAKDILDDKRSQGDEGFQVLFHPTKARLNPLKFGEKFHRALGFFQKLTGEIDENIVSTQEAQVIEPSEQHVLDPTFWE